MCPCAAAYECTLKFQSVLELYILYILVYFTMQAIMQPLLGFTLIKLAQGTIKEMQLSRTRTKQQ